MSERGRGFLTPTEIDRAKQAIDLLCSLANECNERPDASTHEAVDVDRSSYGDGEQCRHFKLTFMLRHNNS